MANTYFFILAGTLAILLGGLGLLPIEQVYAQESFSISLDTGNLPDRSIGISSVCPDSMPREKCVFKVDEIRFIPDSKPIGETAFHYICVDNLKPNSEFHNCSYLTKDVTSAAAGISMDFGKLAYVQAGEGGRVSVHSKWAISPGADFSWDVIKWSYKLGMPPKLGGIPISGNLLFETDIGSVIAGKYVVVGMSGSGFAGTVEFIGQNQPGMKVVVGSGENHGDNDIECFSFNPDGRATSTTNCADEFHDALILACNTCHQVGYRTASYLSSPFPEPTFVSTYPVVDESSLSVLNPDPLVTAEELEGILAQSEKIVKIYETAISNQINLFTIDEMSNLIGGTAVDSLSKKAEAELLIALKDLRESFEFYKRELGLVDLTDEIKKIDELISKLEVLKSLDAEIAKIENIEADVVALTSEVDTVKRDIDKVLNTPIQFSDTINPVPGVSCNVALGDTTSLSCTGNPTIPKTCKNVSPVSGITCNVCIGEGAGNPSCSGKWCKTSRVLGVNVHVCSDGHFHVH